MHDVGLFHWERDKISEFDLSHCSFLITSRRSEAGAAMKTRLGCRSSRVLSLFVFPPKFHGSTQNIVCRTYLAHKRRPRRPPFRLVESDGVGVTSSILPIFMPDRASARRAD